MTIAVEHDFWNLILFGPVVIGARSLTKDASLLRSHTR
jgi:hypothetical protein